MFEQNELNIILKSDNSFFVVRQYSRIFIIYEDGFVRFILPAPKIIAEANNESRIIISLTSLSLDGSAEDLFFIRIVFTVILLPFYFLKRFIPAIAPIKAVMISAGKIRYVFIARLLLLKQSIIIKCMSIRITEEATPKINLFLLVTCDV